MTEEWRPVAGWEGLYEVSDLGRVRSLDRVTPGRWGPTQYKGRTLSPALSTEGYLVLSLSRPGKRTHAKVHQLVADAFLPPRRVGDMLVRHFDGDSLNNRASNLRRGDFSSNMADQLRHGTHHQTLKTHCPHGHAYNAENTRINNAGHRVCRACGRSKK